jgi:hypothetical protein
VTARAGDSGIAVSERMDAGAQTASVLWVDATDGAQRQIAALLAQADDGGRLAVRLVDSLEAARARLSEEEPDVILLRLAGAGTPASVLPVVELRAAAPQVPAVVLAPVADEGLAVKAVQLGAADYLLVERLHGTLLVRCLLHTVEAHRVGARLATLEVDRPSFDRDRAGGIPAASLRQALPHAFSEMVAEYREMLDHSIDQILFRVDHQVETRVRGLARRAGELRAGPRDLVELHGAALEAALAAPGAQRAKLYRAEGRLRLLQLMGHLTTYYRDLALARRRGPQ